MFPVGKMWISLGSIQENAITLKSIYQTKYSVFYSEKNNGKIQSEEWKCIK